MSLNPLNDISKVYLEQVSESAVPGKPAERLGAVTAIPKSEQDAARERILAKAKAKREAMKTEALDPVGQEDADIDNDGDTDKSDKYLHKRRKAIGKAIAKKKGMKEGFSNWRQDLAEVMDDVEASKEIKEKKVSNKIKINPKLGEAVEQLGGTLIEMVEIEGVLDDFTDAEMLLLSNSLIEEVVEEFFYECIEEGYEIDEIEDLLIESIDTSEALLNEAKVTLGHDTKIKSDRLEKVKSAVKKVGGAVARGAGYVAGAAARGAKAVGREFKKGYEKGRGKSTADSQSQTTSSSTSSKPGLLSRIGSKLKSGLKKAVASGARAVSRGARNVARKMEGGETKKVEAPKEKSVASAPKAKEKKAEAPKTKTPASKKKKKSNLDDLLSSIRNEETSVERIDRISREKVAQRAAAAKKEKESKASSAAAFQAHKKEVLAKGGRPVDALDSWQKKQMKKEEVEQIDEKTLTKMEMKKREEIVKSMKDKASDFEKRYPGRGKEVMYATATKMAKKMAEQMVPEPTATVDSSVDKKKEMMDKQKIANMKMLQQKQQMLQKQKLQMQKSGKLPLEAD